MSFGQLSPPSCSFSQTHTCPDTSPSWRWASPPPLSPGVALTGNSRLLQCFNPFIVWGKIREKTTNKLKNKRGKRGRSCLDSVCCYKAGRFLIGKRVWDRGRYERRKAAGDDWHDAALITLQSYSVMSLSVAHKWKHDWWHNSYGNDMREAGGGQKDDPSKSMYGKHLKIISKY